MQCLTDSDLPAAIAKLGYSIEQTGSAERILHSAIVEKLVKGPDGTMVPLTEGSTRPIVKVRSHAGLVPVEEWTFHLH
jgi:hypothetical protein